MDREKVREKIEEAKSIVGGNPQDPLTQVAFGEVLRILLQEYSKPALGKGESKEVIEVKSMQISEFLAQKKINTETDRVSAILYYNLHNGQELSTRGEILDVYSAARTKRPANLSDVIARCIRKGRLIEAKEKKEGQKAWQITLTGERYVEEELAP